jgi:hypothetical protein
LTLEPPRQDDGDNDAIELCRKEQIILRRKLVQLNGAAGQDLVDQFEVVCTMVTLVTAQDAPSIAQPTEIFCIETLQRLSNIHVVVRMYAMIAVVLVVTGTRLHQRQVINCSTLLSAITEQVTKPRALDGIAPTITISTVVDALRDTLTEQMDDKDLTSLICETKAFMTANPEVSKTPTIGQPKTNLTKMKNCLGRIILHCLTQHFHEGGAVTHETHSAHIIKELPTLARSTAEHIYKVVLDLRDAMKSNGIAQ